MQKMCTNVTHQLHTFWVLIAPTRDTKFTIGLGMPWHCSVVVSRFDRPHVLHQFSQLNGFCTWEICQVGTHEGRAASILGCFGDFYASFPESAYILDLFKYIDCDWYVSIQSESTIRCHIIISSLSPLSWRSLAAGAKRTLFIELVWHQSCSDQHVMVVAYVVAA